MRYQRGNQKDSQKKKDKRTNNDLQNTTEHQRLKTCQIKTIFCHMFFICIKSKDRQLKLNC